MAYRETKDIDLSSECDEFDEDFDELSVACSEDGDILEVLSDEDGDIVEALTSSGEDNGNSESDDDEEEEGEIREKAKRRRKTIWTDVVNEQVLSTTLNQINKGPVVTVVDQQMTKKKKRRSEPDYKLPQKLVTYRDLDGENLVLAPVDNKGRISPANPISFNALVKAVERGRNIDRRRAEDAMRAAEEKKKKLRMLAKKRMLSASRSRKRPSALSRLEIDDRIDVNKSLSGEELVAALSRALHEEQSLDTLQRCVELLGVDRCVEFFEKTLVKEKNGGLTIIVSQLSFFSKAIYCDLLIFFPFNRMEQGAKLLGVFFSTLLKQVVKCLLTYAGRSLERIQMPNNVKDNKQRT